jgi:hypothetical protein
MIIKLSLTQYRHLTFMDKDTYASDFDLAINTCNSPATTRHVHNKIAAQGWKTRHL